MSLSLEKGLAKGEAELKKLADENEFLKKEIERLKQADK